MSTATQEFGELGERIAERWLKRKGWRLVQRRFRSGHRDIDLIVTRDDTVAFVEVKARATAEEAGFALDRYRLRRVAVAAERLSQRYMREGDDVRIDALFIVPGRWPRHLADVWQG